MTTDTYFPLETVIAARLEAEAIRYANEVLICRANSDKAAAKEAQRAANAFAKALLYWQDGIRPEQTPAGNWLLPSQRGVGEPPHLLHRSGDWVCSCQAGESWHWAKALIVGVEIAYDTDDLPFDCIGRLRAALEETEAVLWADSDEPFMPEPNEYDRPDYGDPLYDRQLPVMKQRFAAFNAAQENNDWY